MIISIVGRAQQGKSSVARAIVKEAQSKGLTAHVFELSQYILDEAIAMGRIPNKTRAELNNDEVEQLVQLGLERRTENPDYWVNILVKDIATRNVAVSVFPNLRCLNEAIAIRKLGGVIVRVVCYISDGVEYISTTRDPNGPLEIEQYAVVSDYFLVTKRGEAALLGKQAATLFSYLQGRT